MKEKIDRESLGMVTDLLEEAYYMARGFLARNEPTMMEVTMKERAEREMNKIDPFHYRKECKRKGLAFEIIDIKDGNKVRCRKVYLDGHIEGFEGNPLVVNHIFSKMQALKYLAQSINEEYRNILRKCLLSDFYPIETINTLYQKWKEAIEKI